MRYQGILEGFYGPMWTHADRLHLIGHLQTWHMNSYVYSPRDDPYTKYHWDKPYPPAEQKRFKELTTLAAAQGVSFAYAISPGKSFDPKSTLHREKLVEKLAWFIDLGSTFFPIFYDDLQDTIDFNGDSGQQHAARQAEVMNGLAEAIQRRCPKATFLFCPSQYNTAEPSAYLCRLHELLAPAIQTAVTGVDPEADSVCPSTFSDAGAQRYLDNFGRRPFFWDNFNVRDNSLNTLHWSSYRGRGSGVPEICSGILLNPQNQYMLNLPIFGCMGDYLADPATYDPTASMGRHLRAFMGEEAAPLGEELSRWFTTEWFAHPGSGCISSENNLPVLADQGSNESCLSEIRDILEPLQDFRERFTQTLMEPQISAVLAPYAALLGSYATAMVTFCREAPGGETAGEALLAAVDRPETECFRLPASLITYARKLVQTTA
ncbi:MAG: beta-N-acetylglucosaminidase domain-containing protein [Planctomycetota bacterium]|jgi:hypothetical protein